MATILIFTGCTKPAQQNPKANPMGMEEKPAETVFAVNAFLSYKAEWGFMNDKLFNDIDGYIRYKSPCIEDLYKKCGLLWRISTIRWR